MAWTFERIADASPEARAAWPGTVAACCSGRRRRENPPLRPEDRRNGHPRRYTNRTNGLAFAPDGAAVRLPGKIAARDPISPTTAVRATAFLIDGRYHNQPNNLTIDSKGASGSAIRGRLRASGPADLSALEHASVLRLELDPFRSSGASAG